MFSCEIPVPRWVCSRAEQTAPIDGCEVVPDMPEGDGEEGQ